jgi:3-hydroxyacyl-CoA dehydrogenase/enoyl-CoA hydratase/3-hydroxybutyryl-CoA epimerase
MKIFSFQVDGEGVWVVTIDVPGEKVNSLNRESIVQIEDFLKQIENEIEKEIEAVVLVSGKEDNFIAGADVSEFLKITSVDEGRILSLKAQEITNRIENSRVPFVAAIHGACLGLGLDIALACRYRIATDDPRTILGFPEIKLGLIPSAGGTQRLPRLLGISEALSLILSGKSIDSKEGMRIGLVDEIAPKEILLDVAKKRALQISMRKVKLKRPWIRGFGDLIFQKNPIGRKLLFDKIRKRIKNKSRSDYLAPIMALEAIEIGMNSSFSRGLHVESVYFGELSVSDVSRQLIHVFLSTNALVKDPVVNPGIKPKKVEKIGVVGAGFMGSQIAALSADSGITVRLKGKDMESLGRGLRACYGHFEERCRGRSITRLEMQSKLNLISGASDYTGFRRADLVIEAVLEDLKLKQKVLEEVESVTREDAIFASSTSSIPIAQIATHSKRPCNVIGMRFFSPVHKMPLVEIAVTKDTLDTTIATALEFARHLGKTPIVVKDGAGFYTTRILTPYLNEAMRLLGEGATIDDIDNAMVQFGFPVGPLMLIDEIGIDLVAAVMRIMHETLGERLRPPHYIEKLTEDERIGRKGKRGSYAYNGDKRVDKSVYKLLSLKESRSGFPKEEIQERLSLGMINEAVLCLEEGIIRNPRDGDVGAVLGLGFPPFLGGPFRYVDSLGAKTVLNKLENLASRFSPRFAPASLLRDLANQGKRFYND